jgi:hypothetical protein
MVAREPLQKNRCLLQKRRIDIHVTKPSSRSRERRRRKPYVRKARHLLRCDAEDFRGNVTEVAELRVTERHRLLAEAAQRLAVLLRKTASLLSSLALGPRKPTDKILRLCRRTFCLRRLRDLRPRCAHDSGHSSSAPVGHATRQGARTKPPTDPDLDRAQAILEDYARSWDAEPEPAERRKLILSLFAQIWAKDDQIVAVKPNPAFSITSPPRRRCGPRTQKPTRGMRQQIRERRDSNPRPLP